MSGINLGLLLVLAAPTLLFATADSAVLAFVWAGLAALLWFAALIWINLRLAFVGSAIAVEDLSVRAGIRRSWKLTGRGFWRMLGQLALGYFLSNQLVQLIITPIVFIVSLLLGIGITTTAESATAQAAIAVVSVGLLLGLTLISSAVLFAYFACLVTVCFFDQQMRSEGLDLVLIRAEEDR